MKKHIYDKHLTEWISQRIRDYVKEHRNPYETEEFFLSNNCFLITAAFDQEKLRQCAQRSEEHLAAGQQEWKSFRHFYNLVCRQLFGVNYNTKPDQDKPLCIAALDAKESKYWCQAGEIKDLHIHAIWTMPATTDAAFFKAHKQIFSSPHCQFREIDIQPYRVASSDSSLEKMISYATKFSKFNRREANVPNDLEIFPRARNTMRLVA